MILTIIFECLKYLIRLFSFHIPDESWPYLPLRRFENSFQGYTKKRGSPYRHSSHTSRLLALPIVVRTSNAEAHADMYANDKTDLTQEGLSRNWSWVYTHPWTSTAAMLFDDKWNLPEFRSVKNKASSKRLSIYMVPANQASQGMVIGMDGANIMKRLQS